MGARIALVGDYDAKVVAHQGINRSMELAAITTDVSWEWVHTNSIGDDPAARMAGFTGVWVVPASPYASEAGAFAAIRLARENDLAFLGTCGGFQHALLEYARSVLHLHFAGHAETQPDATLPLIAPLSCSLVERSGMVHLLDGSRLRQIYGTDTGEEGYHCSYGLNPQYAGLFENGSLKTAARDDAGDVRAVELHGHPFYLATLFQPERKALSGTLHPLVAAFLEAASV